MTVEEIIQQELINLGYKYTLDELKIHDDIIKEMVGVRSSEFIATEILAMDGWPESKCTEPDSNGAEPEDDEDDDDDVIDGFKGDDLDSN